VSRPNRPEIPVTSLLTTARRLLRRLDRHTLEMCRPPFPYSRLRP
jgi:hypothetical protein